MHNISISCFSSTLNAPRTWHLKLKFSNRFVIFVFKLKNIAKKKFNDFVELFLFDDEWTGTMYEVNTYPQ